MTKEHQALANKYFRWNFNCHFWEGIFAVAAFTIFGVYTIMPGLIHEIVVRMPQLEPIENRLVTLLGICFFGISPVVGFFFTGYFESQKNRMHIFVKWGLIAKVTYVIVALSTFFMLDLGYGAFLIILYISLLMYALISGFMMPQWLDFVARQIPVNRRGIMFGGRDATGNLVGIGILVLFPWISRSVAFPYNYGIIYGIVVVFQLISYVIFISLKEIPYSDNEIRPREPLPRQLKKSLAIFNDDLEYRNLMIATFLISLCTISTMTLYTMKGIRVLGLTGTDIVRFTSWFSIATLVGYIISMPVCGLLADRWGYKKIIYISYSILLSTFIVVIFARTEAAFLTAAFMQGLMRGGNVLASMNFPLEFAPENRRPTYLAVKSLFAAPFAFMPFIGGWISDQWGYNMVFVMGAVFVSLGLLMYYFKVIDPRRRQAAFETPAV